MICKFLGAEQKTAFSPWCLCGRSVVASAPCFFFLFFWKGLELGQGRRAVSFCLSQRFGSMAEIMSYRVVQSGVTDSRGYGIHGIWCVYGKAYGRSRVALFSKFTLRRSNREAGHLRRALIMRPWFTLRRPSRATRLVLCSGPPIRRRCACFAYLRLPCGAPATQCGWCSVLGPRASLPLPPRGRSHATCRKSLEKMLTV